MRALLQAHAPQYLPFPSSFLPDCHKECCCQNHRSMSPQYHWLVQCNHQGSKCVRVAVAPVDSCAYGETTVLETISTLILRFRHHQYPAISSLPTQLSMVSEIFAKLGGISSSKRGQCRLYCMSYARRNAMELKWSAFAGFWSVEHQLPERFLCVQLGRLQRRCGARERSELGK